MIHSYKNLKNLNFRCRLRTSFKADQLRNSHHYNVCIELSKFCLPKEQLIKKLVPEQGAFNSLRQAGLHTSFVLSFELGASLRGGWALGVGGEGWGDIDFVPTKH